MSAREMLGLVGSVVGGVIGWSTEAPPAADPADLRGLLTDLGLPAGSRDEQVTAAVCAFQQRVGLPIDGVAGPRTVHLLARHAKHARELDLTAVY